MTLFSNVPSAASVADADYVLGLQGSTGPGTGNTAKMTLQQIVNLVGTGPLASLSVTGNASIGGALTLSGNPTTPLGAAPKQYVDLMLPLAGGTMTGALAMGANALSGSNVNFTGGTIAAVASGSSSLTIGSTNSRTLAQRGGDFDADGTHGAVYNAKDFGFKTGNTAAQNRTALLAMIAAAKSDTLNFKKIRIPAGTYNVDVGAGPWTIDFQSVTIEGDGAATTAFVLSGTGDAWSVTTTGGFVTLRGFYMFRNDNTSSGNFIKIQKGPAWIDNINMAGAFGGIEIASAQAVTISNIQISGTNTSSGSYGVLVHKSASGGTLPAGIFIANSNIRPTNDYSVIVRACDGLWVTGCQVAFARVAALLHQPEFTNDQITGVRCAGTWLESAAGYGIHYAPIASGSMTGFEGYDTYSGCFIRGGGGDGAFMEDGNVDGITWTGCTFLSSGNNGLNLTAGNGYCVSGNDFQGNNVLASGSADIAISGTAGYVSVSSNLFEPHSGVVAAYHIAVSGSADNIVVGSNVYHGASAAPITNTSTGANINLGDGTIANSVTAHAGGGQANATLISADFATLGTVATAGDSVKLRPTSSGTVGSCQMIANTTANSAQVFGSGSDTINGIAATTGVALPAGKTGIWFTTASGQWFGGTLT